MKKLLVILLSALSLIAFAQQKKVAVYMTGQQSGESNVLGDQLVAAFAKSGRYTAVERTSSFLAELAKEQGYQRSGSVSDDEIARLGVQFGVNYVCVAQISDVFGEKYISARLIDVETAEIVNTHNVSGTMNNMSSCLRMANEIASNLTRGTFAEQANEERAKAESIAKEKAAKERAAALEREQKAEAERQKAQKAREREQRAIQNEKNNPGYVDLGLPSGTLWAKYNESKKYKYSDAVKTFGKQMPNDDQMKELLRYCKRETLSSGCKFIGPNNHYVVFQFSGYQRGLEKIAVGVNGFYLYRGYEYRLLKVWGSGGYNLANGFKDDKYSIRLVK